MFLFLLSSFILSWIFPILLSVIFAYLFLFILVFVTFKLHILIIAFYFRVLLVLFVPLSHKQKFINYDHVYFITVVMATRSFQVYISI